MFEEFMMPLNRHFDSGFGATADTFHDAAKALDTDEHKRGFGLNSSRLPLFYLYRHAIELYLKSMLTVLHRRFSSDYPLVDFDSFPSIFADGKEKRIFNVHSINLLYQQFRNFLSDNREQIKSFGRTDWTEVPEGTDELIQTIDEVDRASTLFRYPITLDPLNDAKKSSFKRIEPADVAIIAQHRTQNNLPGIKILALKNEEDEIVESFIFDEDPMPDVLNALKEVATLFSGAHYGMRYEFIDASN